MHMRSLPACLPESVAGEADYSQYMLKTWRDASLSPNGYVLNHSCKLLQQPGVLGTAMLLASLAFRWQQALRLRAHVQACIAAGSMRPALVVVSPLARTMQTACVAFGGPIQGDGQGSAPLLMAPVLPVPRCSPVRPP
jgi:hypothetical protein